MKHLARFLAHDMIRGRSPNTKHPGWKCLTFLIFPIDACEILRLEGFTISCVVLLKYPCLLSLLAARDTPAPVSQEMPNAGWNFLFLVFVHLVGFMMTSSLLR
jgi:hypothetical protein